VVVAAVSTVSYGSYVLHKLARRRGGVVLAGLLGSIYSSTVTTVALANQARRERAPLYAFGRGGVLALAALGLAQAASGSEPVMQSILTAAANNNVAKSIYALVFGGYPLWRARCCWSRRPRSAACRSSGSDTMRA
jgi:uncharacterized membrane protein (DUF4010 family)